MGKKKTVNQTGDSVTTKEELTDANLSELENDLTPEAEAEEAEPSGEVSDDLPEGSTVTEGESEPPEPEVDPERAFLEKHGLYRPNLIENFDDMAKSLRYHEQREADLVEAARSKPAPEPDPQAIMAPLLEGIESDDPQIRLQTYARIAAAVSPKAEIEEIKQQLFEQKHPDAAEIGREISEIQRTKGHSYEDAYWMVRGKNVDKYSQLAADEAVKTQQKRELERQLALREKPGSGTRTTPASVEQEIQKLAQDSSLSSEEQIARMEALLNQRGMGLEE